MRSIIKSLTYIILIVLIIFNFYYAHYLKEDNIIYQKQESERREILISENNILTKKINEQNTQIAEKNKVIERLSLEAAKLENKIKELMSIGKLPKNYKIADKVSRGSFEEFRNRMSYLGVWLGTYYCPSEDECGNDKGITASGKPVIAGHSIAIDPKYWRFGTKFYLEGYGIVEAVDTGRDIKGKNRLDLCVFSDKISHSGSFKVKVWLVN